MGWHNLLTSIINAKYYIETQVWRFGYYIAVYFSESYKCCTEHIQGFIVEIDRYIGLPIFFQIFKHFTIIGYRF